MKPLRLLIDNISQLICWLKKNQRIKLSDSAIPVKVNLGCGLTVAKGWINIDGSLNALFSSCPKFVLKLIYRLTGASNYYSCEDYVSLLSNYRF
ncbi:MAG: hypothetical protein PHY48_16865, partial [Candidatus Cloacimonetes bacterium]|nr:hypothetical protein [Candidatus Cloacimonadota bacterium]